MIRKIRSKAKYSRHKIIERCLQFENLWHVDREELQAALLMELNGSEHRYAISEPNGEPLYKERMLLTRLSVYFGLSCSVCGKVEPVRQDTVFNSNFTGFPTLYGHPVLAEFFRRKFYEVDFSPLCSCCERSLTEYLDTTGEMELQCLNYYQLPLATAWLARKVKILASDPARRHWALK